jgi:hypothetical protein
MKEFNTGIPRPDRTEKFAWAKIKDVRKDWLRAIGAHLDFDPAKMILGEAMGNIEGDDPNAFGMFFMPEIAYDVKGTIDIVMKSEINSPELPQNIHDRLVEVHSGVMALDLTTENGYKEAKKIYQERLIDFVNQEIALHPEYEEARKYAHEVNLRISPYWQMFLYGSVGY